MAALERYELQISARCSVLGARARARARVRRGGSCEAWDGREEGKTIPNVLRNPRPRENLANPGRDPSSECRILSREMLDPGNRRGSPPTAPSTSAVGDVIVLCGKHGPAGPCRRPVPSAFSFPCVPETRKYHSPMVADGILLPVQQFESIRRRIPSSRRLHKALPALGLTYPAASMQRGRT